MKKTTPTENLSKKLIQYCAFSASVLGMTDVNGQIVYTDIADETVNPGENYALDLNNDATGDLLFMVNTGGNFAFMFPVSSISASSYNSNAIVGFSSYPYNYPSNLNTGDVIDSTNGVFSLARGDFNYSSCAYPGSQFCDGMDGYIGIHLVVGADTYYGWARIQVAPDASSITIKDYAYNSTPGEAIEAGQTLSVDEFSRNNIRIVALDNTINLYNLPSSINYSLFSVNGQKVANGSVADQDSYTIEAYGLASGVYIIELVDSNTKDVLRKKIVL